MSIARPIHFQPWTTATSRMVQVVEPSHGMWVPSISLTAPSVSNSAWKT
jgi:hypothetical protein